MAQRGRPIAPETILPVGQNPVPHVDLRDLIPNLREIVLQTADEATTIQWLTNKGLIANQMMCTNGHNMRLHNKHDGLDGIQWKCGICRTKKSIRRGSFFSGSHLRLNQLVDIMVWWATDTRQGVVQSQVGVAEHAIVDWMNFLRDICLHWEEDHMEPIGGVDAQGVGKIVEIDETLFLQRKNHVGANRGKDWVFGGVERDNPDKFFFIKLPIIAGVPQRDAARLHPIIQRWILPGTHIISDGWAAYHTHAGGSRLENLGGQGTYIHDVVIHNDNFVDPNKK